MARRPVETGRFLPTVFPNLEAAGIRLREGVVSMIAGPPGVMKSGLALYWLGRMKVPVLYFSADMEPFEVFERAGAMMTGDTMEQVRRNPTAYEEGVNALPMRFVFDDSPTYDDVLLEVMAYVEVFGQPPKVICIDNLMNLTGDNEDEWAAHREHSKVIHKIGRITKSAFLVLAHMTDDANDVSYPQPRKKLQGKVSQLPKVILSLGFDGEWLRVAPVKNRFGRPDSTGKTYVELYAWPQANQFFNSRNDFLEGRPA